MEESDCILEVKYSDSLGEEFREVWGEAFSSDRQLGGDKGWRYKHREKSTLCFTF